MQNLLYNNINFIISIVSVSFFISNYYNVDKSKKKYTEFFKFFYSLVNKNPLFMGYNYTFKGLYLFKVSLFSLSKINDFLNLLYEEINEMVYNKNLKDIKFYNFDKFFNFNVFIDNNKLNFFSYKYNLKDNFDFRNVNFNIGIKFKKNITNKFRIYYVVRNKFKLSC